MQLPDLDHFINVESPQTIEEKIRKGRGED